MFKFFPVFFILYYKSFAKHVERFLDPLSTIQKQDKNKLGLSCAKLNSSLASYARCANCFQLDCLPCVNMVKSSYIGHRNLVIIDTGT